MLGSNFWCDDADDNQFYLSMQSDQTDQLLELWAWLSDWEPGHSGQKFGTV